MPDRGGTGAAVRPLTSDDLPFAAALHHDALPDGFFVALGTSFLAHYYETFIASPHAIALLGLLDGGPIGVLVGTLDHGRHYQWIARHRRRQLALAALRGLGRQPGLLVVFVRTRALRYLRGMVRLARRGREAEPTSAGPTTGVLTHVAVVPEARDHGVGSALVATYTDSAFAAGSKRLRVATKVVGGATAFYRNLGWREAGTMRNLDGTDFDVLVLDR